MGGTELEHPRTVDTDQESRRLFGIPPVQPLLLTQEVERLDDGPFLRRNIVAVQILQPIRLQLTVPHGSAESRTRHRIDISSFGHDTSVD
ncbi:Uncharacterised protein [Mycobacteroides abscessus]|nr:Uncharacterised protein [Mycobacteroides abscessus]